MKSTQTTKNSPKKNNPMPGGPTAKEIEVNGHHFESIAAFSRHLSLNPAKVRARIHRGEKPEDIWAAESKYKIDGVEFESIKALADHYNTTEDEIEKGLQAGLSISQAVGVSFVPHDKKNSTMTLNVDGKNYPNTKAITTAFNVNQDEFTALLTKNKTPQEAIDSLRSKKRPPKASRVPKPININGVDYPSENAAAKAHGVSASAFYQRRKKGMTPEDALDLSKKSADVVDSEPVKAKTSKSSNAKRTPVEATAARSKPVTLGKKKYRSQRALCRDLKISPHAFRHALSTGLSVEDAVKSLAPVDMEAASTTNDAEPLSTDEKAHNEAKSAAPQSITYRGKVHRSIRAFANHFDQQPSQVRYRLKQGWTPAQAIGKAKPPKDTSSDENMINVKNMMPVNVEGKEFKTAASLAKHYGLASSVVTGRLRNGWTPEESVELTPHRVGKKGSFLRTGSKTFSNARELADAHGKPYRTVQYRLSQGATAPEAVGLKPWKGKPHRGKKITFRDVEYTSKKALADAFGVESVSYTHLTLPTICSV